MRSHSYINSASEIITSYDGSMPLASFLKQFFKANKKFGSTDRKQIAHACYCYYRLGNAFASIATDEKILIGLFLSSKTENIFLKELKREWNQQIGLSMDEKLKLVPEAGEIYNLFPLMDELSDQIELDCFHLSFLIQPDLFLRIRPGRKEKVVGQLDDAGTDFKLIENDCLQLNNQIKIDEILHLDADAVVQDYNSQKVLESIKNFFQRNAPAEMWDCCAASGGKSILFHDHYPSAHITVSDVRESILINLEKRFKRAGIHNYKAFIADVSSEGFSMKKNFDLVICDAPCSGSGTWSRVPESMSFFKKEKIDHYSNLQKRIALNAINSVKETGYFIYITCSVFKKENEEVVDFIQRYASVKLESMQYFKGYDKKADTLFTAVFSKL